MSPALPRPTAARAAGLALLLGLGLPTLTACGAGFEAQTYQERSASDSTNAAVGPIAVRNVAVVPDDEGVVEAGADADAILTLVNVGGEDDRLVGATTEAASSVDLEVDGDEVSAIDVPRMGTTGSTAGLVLRDVGEELRSGEVIEITLRFERAGEVTVEAPIQTTGEYDEDREKSANFHPPGEEGEGEGASGDTVNEGDAEGEDGGGPTEAGEESTEPG